MWKTNLWDPRATGVRGKHFNQYNGQEGKGQSPVRVHEVVHNVGARTLKHITHHNIEQIYREEKITFKYIYFMYLYIFLNLNK